MFEATSHEDQATSEEIKKIFDKAYTLFCAKHDSYGPGNIAEFGSKGVFIRMSDKMKRLKRLVWQSKNNPLKNESVEDTYLDIINYAAISMVCLMGKWPDNMEDVPVISLGGDTESKETVRVYAPLTDPARFTRDVTEALEAGRRSSLDAAAEAIAKQLNGKVMGVPEGFNFMPVMQKER